MLTARHHFIANQTIGGRDQSIWLLSGTVRAMLDPDMPEILKALVQKAKDGVLTATKLILDRVYPARDAAMADLQEEVDDLRAIIEKSTA